MREGFFSFFLGSQCVPQHNITMCSFSLSPIKTPGRRGLVSVRSKFKSVGSGLSVTHLSPPHPSRRARSVEIRECRAESVCNRPLLPPPPTPGPVDLNAGLGLSTLFWGVAELVLQKLLIGRNGQV